MTLLLGIDLGTSYFKVGLFDETGELKGLCRIAVEPIGSASGHNELPVDTFWQLLRYGLADALQQAGAEAREVTGVSYSAQANTFILLDRQDAALTPLILWTDTRGEPLVESLVEFSQTSEYRQTVGFGGLSGGWAVAKLRWFQEEMPDLWKSAKRIMTISDYFTFALTGERVGDAGTAAFLGLYDLSKKEWWPAALHAFALAPQKLSTPLPPGSPCGRTSAKAATLIGLPAGIPFAVGGLDHQVAALGSGIGRFADLSISTGTVLAAMMLVPEVVPKNGCYHGPHFDGTTYFRLAFDSAGAGQLEDYQRQYAPHLTLEQLIAFASSVPAGGQPLRRSNRSSSEREHGVAVRYVLEKIGHAHRLLVEQVASGGRAQKIVATGGGARSALWLQIKANMIGLPIVTTACPERACLGAAMLAGLSSGTFGSLAEASRSMVHKSETYLPNPRRQEFYRDWALQAKC